MKDALRRHAPKVAALALILVTYGAARLPALSGEERARLASHFFFTGHALPTLGDDLSRTHRAVHPSLSKISSWISSVGAAIALYDLDRDGYANDVCYVDTRTDLVVVAPMPDTGDRYPPFALDPDPLPYDPATTAPMGMVPGDFNEDGWPDVLVYYWGRTPVLFLGLSGEDGLSGRRFAPRELLSGPPERWFTNAATSADLDGDGHVDLVFGNYFQDGARILDAAADGVERMQHSMSRAYNGGVDRIFLWSGAETGEHPAATFREVPDALEPQVARGWTLAVGARDLDGDLLPELYFANDFGPDRLLYNRSRPGEIAFARLEGERTLTTPRSKVLGHDSFKGMGVDFGDVNGDALPDIYVSNIAAEFMLEESHFLWTSTGETGRMKDGVAPYRDRSEQLGVSRSGWGWDTKFGDFDNDGVLEALQATGFVKGEVNRWPELHELAMGNDDLLRFPGSWFRAQDGDDLSGHQHNPFYVRSKSGRYFDLAPELGLGVAQVTRGIATADVNGDGRLDFAVANQWDESRYYRNQCQAPGAFLGLHLLLPVGEAEVPATIVRRGFPDSATRGRFAVGAQVKVRLADRTLIGEVDGGNGHSGVRSPELHFGLGALTLEDPVRVEVRWRDRHGMPHRTELELKPGWYTVLLGEGGAA